MRVTRLAWLLGLLGLLPVHSFAKDTYPPIDSDSVVSPSYELRRLLCERCGRVMDVVYLPERDSFFVSTRDDVWQINRHGHVVDVLRGHGPLPDSGIYFGQESYIDWTLSGDKTPKTYRDTLNADHLSDEEFNAQMQAADARSFRWAEEHGRAYFYLREEDDWRRLERAYQISQEHLAMRAPKGVIHSYPAASNNENETLPFLRITRYSTPIDYNWRDADNPLYLHQYRRQGRVRKPFLDFNSHGWSGTYGRGQFHLQHRGEQLAFSALHRVTKNGTSRDSPDIDLYRLPQEHPAAAISFLGLYGRRQQLDEEEQGFYVVRPRTDQTASPPPPSALHRQFQWQPVFAGFAQQQGTLRHMIFINGQDESPHTRLDHTLDSKPRPVPLVWDFFHKLPEFEGYDRDYIKLNQTYYILRDRFKSGDGSYYAKLKFDEAETMAAFTRLQQRSKDDNTPITLNFSAKWLTGGLVYRLALQRGDEQIPLDRARIHDQWELDEIPQRYILDRLDQVFDNAIDDASFDRDFMATASYLLQDNPTESKIAEAFASATVKLMIARLQNQDADAAEALFYHYIEQILPRTDFHPKALDIASNALALGIIHQRPKVIDSAFSHLLGGDNPDIQALNNNVLVYNLACYYALQQQKTKMLEASARAIELGKKPEQFLADKDFTRYWYDREFLAVIYQ